MLSDKQLKVIERHIAAHIGEVENVFHELIPLDVHVDIELIPPRPERNFFTLVTAGMSEHAMSVPDGEDAASDVGSQPSPGANKV